MSVRLTWHAAWRAETRTIDEQDIARALAGRRIELRDGSELFYDPRTRTTIVVAAPRIGYKGAQGDTAPTVYRLQKKVLKARYSR